MTSDRPPTSLSDYRFGSAQQLPPPTLPDKVDSQSLWWNSIEPEERLLTGRAYLVAKRAFDCLLLLLCVPLLPLYLLIALLIKLDSPGGPIIFKQYRTGINGQRFEIYKFRTMVPKAEEMKRELSSLNELQYPDFKITKDPRVTRVGRLLRKTSLDELPQLYNIFKGDMSFVGPRPTTFAAETYSLWQTVRLDVKPGLTGLWQVVNRNSDFTERVLLDIAYIERRCIWLDFQILLRTIGEVLKLRGV